MRCVTAGLREYELSGDMKCFWFPEGFVEEDKIHYLHLDGRKAYRCMVGYKTLLPKDGKERLRTWHFAIQGKIVRRPG